jgi:hypothetical protein
MGKITQDILKAIVYSIWFEKCLPSYHGVGFEQKIYRL